MSNNFWNKNNPDFENIHNTTKQLNKQKYARQKRLTEAIVNIDKENKTASFRSSSIITPDYNTTLDNCTCPTFLDDKKPCKHMYRLAHELNVFDISPKKSNTKENSNINQSDYPEILEDFWNKNTPYYSDLHNNVDQITRQVSACKKKLTPINIDKENKICFIKGSGKEPYTITLKSCTCSDFIRRKLPCKHMYRLAYELNLMPPPKPIESSISVKIKENDKIFEVLNKDTGEITTINKISHILNKITPKQKVLLLELLDGNGGLRFESTPLPLNSDLKNILDLHIFNYKIVNLFDEMENHRNILDSLLETLNIDPYKELNIQRFSSKKVTKYLKENFKEEILNILNKYEYIILSLNPDFDSYYKLARKLKESFTNTHLCYNCYCEKNKKTIDEEICIFINECCSNCYQEFETIGIPKID